MYTVFIQIHLKLLRNKDIYIYNNNISVLCVTVSNICYRLGTPSY